jgi:hypothetical protein
MAVKIGKLAKVTLGAVTVAEIGSYTLSGMAVDAIEITAFGDEAKDFIPGMIDPGDVSIKGNYDPSDATGQIALETACKNGTEYGPGDIRFYLDNTIYLTPKTGGTIIITKCKAISMDKAGVGTIEFTGKLSGAPLVQIG